MSEQQRYRDNTKRETVTKRTTLKIGCEPDEPTGWLSALGAWLHGFFRVEIQREDIRTFEQIDTEASSIPSEQREQLAKDCSRDALAENQRIHEAKRLGEGKDPRGAGPESPEEIAKRVRELEEELNRLRERGFEIDLSEDSSKEDDQETNPDDE